MIHLLFDSMQCWKLFHQFTAILTVWVCLLLEDTSTEVVGSLIYRDSTYLETMAVGEKLNSAVLQSCEVMMIYM